ncbi:lytic transglycosylase domain-containing protein [Corynebacterium urogenitale]
MANNAKRSVGKIPTPKNSAKSTSRSAKSTNRTGAGSQTSRPVPSRPQRVNSDWERMSAHQRPNRGILGGCGLFFVVIALLAIIALVGFLVAGVASRDSSGPERIPIPDDVPPAAAKPAPGINIHSPGRTALQLLDWARPISEKTGIPTQALIAYGNAEVIARDSRPECGITWNTLAGLGYVETIHGTYDGKRYGASELNRRGTAEPKIYGPQLNGDGFAKITDTDGGRMDGDKEFDRAVGPLQFIPESWERYGVDANGDGRSDPQNIDDASASAVRLLCDFDRDLSTPDGWTRAIRSYNLSDEYVLKVRDAAANYALGQAPVGSAR